MENEYLTVEDSDGVLRPLAVLWPAGRMQQYYQPEIDKYMKRASKEGMKLVKVKIIKLEN